MVALRTEPIKKQKEMCSESINAMTCKMHTKLKTQTLKEKQQIPKHT